MSAIASAEICRSSAGRAFVALASVLALVYTARALGEGTQDPMALSRATTPSTLPADGTVQFPNDAPLTVAFRATPAEEVSSAAFGEYPARLSSAKQGDVESARIVGRLMVYCAAMRGIPFSTQNTKTYEALASKTPTTEKNAASREFCAQRTTEEIASGVNWLEAAAATGDLWALQRLVGLYRPGSDEDMRVLNGIWQRGSVSALRSLSTAHWVRSRESGPDGEDAARALAASWLYAKLNESAFREHSTSSAFVGALEKELASRMARASSSLQTEAIATARGMLSQNAQCCSIP